MPGQSRSFGRSIDDARREFHQSEREVLLDDMEVSGKYVTFYKPDVIDMAQLLSAAQSEDNDLVRIVRILNVMSSMMPSEDALHVERAIRARALELDDLMGMVETVLEVAGGFPTKRPSGSTRSPRSAGPSSTAGSRRVRSTPSVSPRTAS